MKARALSDTELEEALRRAQDARASASLRAAGSARMLGDLHLRGMEHGLALHLLGAKHRDILPPEGTTVNLTMLLGDDVLSLESQLLTPIASEEGETRFPPILRVAWPKAGVVLVHRRRDLRVAATGQTPLKATITLEGKAHRGLVVNLTETGLGLALEDEVLPELRAKVTVDTTLPEDLPFHCQGELRHYTYLEEDAHPTRMGLAITKMAAQDEERLHAFIQLRRADRSESLRQPRNP
jgi:c-di-GMP-binding flagellar brake protein YcgR